MESNQVQMYQISRPEQSNNKENVVLRTLVGDPNRHKPLVQHPTPTTNPSEEPIPASMYTLETRYQPIPPKVLPKKPSSRVYYIDSQKAGQTSQPNSPIIQEDKPLPAEPEAPKQIEEENEPVAPVFLEPKIISQPIMYSIVGAKARPVPNVQPISVDQEEPLPFLYSIIGQPYRPTTDMNPTALNVAPSVINKSPILYTLIGCPRLQVRFQEPIQQVLQVSHAPQESPPNLYTVVGGPRISPEILKSVIKQTSQMPEQHSPTLYSIIGNPIVIPNITQTNTVNPLPLLQPENVSSVQPVPILYTLVGGTHVPNNIPKEKRQPLAPNKRETNDATMYTVVGEPTIPQSMPASRKTQPLQPIKQPPPAPPPQKQPTEIPSLYTLVGKPSPLPDEKFEPRLKPLVQTRSPQAPVVPTRRISRSLDRQTAPDLRTEPIISMPPIKNKRQRPLKEPTIPKSETTFYPLPEQKRTTRPKQTRTTPWHTSPERGQINHRNFRIPKHDGIQLSDYISPYAYHPTKPYREQTIYPSSLPILANSRSERKARSRYLEAPYRGNRKQSYDPWTPHSLERYPVKNKEHSRLWDFEDQAQTDNDDDINELDSSRSRKKYRRYRPRTPWIPVW